jgi:hypothetical protein
MRMPRRVCLGLVSAWPLSGTGLVCCCRNEARPRLGSGPPYALLQGRLDVPEVCSLAACSPCPCHPNPALPGGTFHERSAPQPTHPHPASPPCRGAAPQAQPARCCDLPASVTSRACVPPKVPVYCPLHRRYRPERGP